MKNHHSYDVILLPPKDIAQEAIRLSQEVAKQFPIEFILDGKTKYPHLTLYQVEIPDKNIKEATNRLKKIFKQPKISLQLTGFVNSDTFISWDYQKGKTIYRLHREVVNKLNPLREGLITPTSRDWGLISPGELPFIEKFGSGGVLKNFRPHITITRVQHRKDIQVALSIFPNKKLSKVVFNKAALGKLANHGTVTKILMEFNLQ